MTSKRTPGTPNTVMHDAEKILSGKFKFQIFKSAYKKPPKSKFKVRVASAEYLSSIILVIDTIPSILTKTYDTIFVTNTKIPPSKIQFILKNIFIHLFYRIVLRLLFISSYV